MQAMYSLNKEILKTFIFWGNDGHISIHTFRMVHWSFDGDVRFKFSIDRIRAREFEVLGNEYLLVRGTLSGV